MIQFSLHRNFLRLQYFNLLTAFGFVGAGPDGARSKLGSVFLPFLIAIVIVLIFDISHSRVGLIQIGQQPLVDLQQSMKVNQ